MSIQQNFPAISPSLSLNFARSKTLDPRITFSRTSTATRVNETGLIEVMSADEPRFDHKYENGVVKSLGLLIEEQRSNTLPYSEDFSQSDWATFGTASKSSNVATAPDGNFTADSITIPTSSGVYDNIAASASTTYTFSSYIRGTPGSTVRILLNFNSSGVTSKTVTVSDVWKRFDVTATSNASDSNVSVQYDQGNGNTFYVWGAQLEAGSFPTSYIPTEGSTKTRSPDNVSMTGTNLADWFNPDEGTVYADTLVNGVKVPSFNRLWSFTNSNFNFDGFGFYISANTNTDGRYGISGEINEESIYSSALISTIKAFDTPRMKSCFGFVKGGNCNVSFNGTLPNSNGVTATDFPDIDRFLIGQPQRFQGYSCMTVSQLTYYPRRLTNDQLQNLTK